MIQYKYGKVLYGGGEKMICKYCGKEIGYINGFCDDVCQGKYYGEKSLLIDYGIGICKTCGNEFKKKSTNQVYCGKECRSGSYKKIYESSKMVYKKECEKCGQEFETTSKIARYCSEECKKKLYKYVCIRCGEEFESTTRNRKICSPDCLKRTRYTKICEYCGIEYETTDKNSKCCSGRCRDDSRRKTHREFIDELIEVHEGTIVPLEMYKSANSNIKCKCIICDREYNKQAHRYIGSYKEGCQCRLSKGEVQVRSWLDKHNISYKEQYGFDDLKYKGKLLFDFAIIDDNKVSMLIEYDGEQHYGKPKHWSKKKFDNQKLRDSLKNKYCEENNIRLLRIPYYESNVDGLLNKELGYE